MPPPIFKKGFVMAKEEVKTETLAERKQRIEKIKAAKK